MSLTTREILEAALVEDFENLATHSAYADLLIEENDPRGEYIQLRLRHEDETLPLKTKRAIEQEASHLYHQHQRDWLGDLAPFLVGRKRLDPEPGTPNYEFTFKRGWLWELDVHDVRHSFTRVLADSPHARMVNRLTLRNTDLRNNDRVLEPLEESACLGSVRYLQLGDEDWEGQIVSGESIPLILDRMPNLEEVILLVDPVETGRVFGRPWPKLVRLSVSDLEQCPLDALGNNSSLTRLESLTLEKFDVDAMFAASEAERDAALAPFAATVLSEFFHSRFLTELKTLRLRLPGFGDRGCEVLVQSEMLPRLRQLELRQCQITDHGAEILAQSPNLRRLEKLDIGGNFLTQSGIDRLLETGVSLQYDSQAGTINDWDDAVPF